MADLSEKAQIDVHKVVFLANENPKKLITEIAGMFQASPLDVNAAIWRAQDHGFLSIDAKGKIDVLRVPETWLFGKPVEALLESIPYIFKKLAENEADMESNFFETWSNGYTNQDINIAMAKLKNDKIMGEYVVRDMSTNEKGEEVSDDYTFYCLFENLEKRWGEKQFKDQKKLQRELESPEGQDEAEQVETGDSEKTEE